MYTDYKPNTIARWQRCLSVICLLSFLLAGWAGANAQTGIRATLAAPGDLDPTFGNGGKVTTQFSFAHATGVAVQADGKIVVAGTDESNSAQFVLARYHTDGSLDTSFGNGGKVSTSVGQPFNYAYGIAIQADGKIVVAGYAGGYGPTRDFAVVRYETDGSLDTSFDGDGKVIIDMGGDNFANDLAIQPDGKIVVVGASGTSEPSRDFAFAVARLNSDGTLDASFDGDGKVITSLGPFSDFGATAVALQPGGKIVVAGQSGSGNVRTADFALVRYNADGSLDTSFDGDGKLITAVSSDYDRVGDVAVQPDGKIVVVGGAPGGAVVVRHNANGSLDTSFGGSGIVFTDLGLGIYSFFGSVAIQSNGKIVAGGYNLEHVVARYNPNGSLDTSFGGDGIVTTSFDKMGYPLGYGGVGGLALQPDGNIVAAGNWGLDGEFQVIAIARYIGDAASPNVIDDAQFFVRQHYRDFLDREPDAAGLAFWTNEITSCGADQSCIEAKRINVSAAYFLSIEFQQTGYFVYRIYKASYGNLSGLPVPIKLNEFQPDSQQISQGVIVNQSGWEQVLENNKQAFTSGFVQRSRFTSAFPTSMTPAEFVDSLFANASVTPLASDRANAINEFGSATNTVDAAARARALRRVAENSTLAQQEFNRAFVLMQYFGYLRRNPNDLPEPTLDFQGYNFWLNKLNQFNGDYIGAEMVKAFITSAECRHRFDDCAGCWDY